jgi:hypothetical protein
MFDAKMGSKKNANFTNFWKIEYAEKMNNGLSLVAPAFKTSLAKQCRSQKLCSNSS